MKQSAAGTGIIIATLALLSWSPAIRAQEGFEPPSLGEFIGGELAAAFDAAQQAAASKAQFNAEIRAARTRYINALKKGERSGSDFTALQYDFARLLAAKDIYYLTLFVAEGVTNETLARARATDSLTGGALDNAIPEHAWKAFSDWVFEVRFNLGAGWSGQIPRAMDSDSIIAAIRYSSEAYERYTKKRDEAEFIAAGLISPKDIPSARPGRIPPEIVALQERLFDASMGELQPDLKEHDFAPCILPAHGECDNRMRDDDGNLRDTNRNRMEEVVMRYHLPGVYRLEMLRSPFASDDFEQVTGSCIIFDNPVAGEGIEGAAGLVTRRDNSSIDEPVHVAKRLICDLGGKTYAFHGTQSAIDFRFPFGIDVGRFYDEADLFREGLMPGFEGLSAGYQGPSGKMIPLSLDSDTLVGYEERGGPTGHRDRHRVIATKLVREGDLIDLNSIALEGTYEVSLRYGDGLFEQASQILQHAVARGENISELRERAPAHFASANYRLRCAIRSVGVYHAMEMACVDEDGVLLTPGRNSATSGYCLRPEGRKSTDGPRLCRRHGPEPRSDFVPAANIARGRGNTAGAFEVFKPQIVVREGQLHTARSFASLNSPLILANPTVSPTAGKARLIMQWGELFGEMVRIGEAAPLNDADRDWLAFYGDDMATGTEASNQAGPQISLSKSTLQPGDTLDVHVSGLPGNPKDWLTLAPATNSDRAWGREYFYTRGKTLGTWSFKAPDTPGAYEVRVYYDDGYTVRARARITVQSNGDGTPRAMEPSQAGGSSNSPRIAAEETSPTIALARTSFRAGEAIEVVVSGLPGNRTDWVTIAPADYTPDRWGPEFKYTKGVSEGKWSFWAPNAPGMYEVRVYFDYPKGGMEIRARAVIEVLPSE